MPYTSKSRKAKWNKDYYKNHHERKVAEDAVYYAKKTGKLIPQPCQICGAIKTEAHHKDYSKPLSVTWLCKRCHRLVHNSKIDL
jgi:ribosomal protein S27AE